jgi:hypothetical protein
LVRLHRSHSRDFFGLPSPALLDVITAPMRQIDDVRCSMLLKVRTVIYVILFGGRSNWKGSHCAGQNAVQNWLSGPSTIANDSTGNDRPSNEVRSISFVFIFLIDLWISLLSMGSVYMFKKHDKMLSETVSV